MSAELKRKIMYGEWGNLNVVLSATLSGTPAGHARDTFTGPSKKWGDAVCELLLNKFGSSMVYLGLGEYIAFHNDPDEDDLILFMRCACTKDFAQYTGDWVGDMWQSGFPQAKFKSTNADAANQNIYFRKNKGFPQGILRIWKWIRDKMEVSEDQAGKYEAIPEFWCKNTDTHGNGMSAIGAQLGRNLKYGVPVGSQDLTLTDRGGYRGGNREDPEWHAGKDLTHLSPNEMHYGPALLYHSQVHSLFMANFYGSVAVPYYQESLGNRFVQPNNRTILPHLAVYKGGPRVGYVDRYNIYKSAIAAKFRQLYQAWQQKGTPATFDLPSGEINEYVFFYFYSIYHPITNTRAYDQWQLQIKNNPAAYAGVNLFTGDSVFLFADLLWYDWGARGRCSDGNKADIYSQSAFAIVGKGGEKLATHSLEHSSDDYNLTPTRYREWYNNNNIEEFIQAVLNAKEVQVWDFASAQKYKNKLSQMASKLTPVGSNQIIYKHRPYTESLAPSLYPISGLKEPWKEAVKKKVRVNAFGQSTAGAGANLLLSYNDKWIKNKPDHTANFLIPTWIKAHDDSWRLAANTFYPELNFGKGPFINSGFKFGPNKKNSLEWKIIGAQAFIDGAMFTSVPRSIKKYNNATDVTKWLVNVNRTKEYTENQIHTLLAQKCVRKGTGTLVIKDIDDSEVLNYDYSGQTVETIAAQLRNEYGAFRAGMRAWVEKNKSNTGSRAWKELMVEVESKDRSVATYMNPSLLLPKNSKKPNWRDWSTRAYEDYKVLWKDMHCSEYLFDTTAAEWLRVNKEKNTSNIITKDSVFQYQSALDAQENIGDFKGKASTNFDYNDQNLWVFPHEDPPPKDLEMGYNMDLTSEAQTTQEIYLIKKNILRKQELSGTVYGGRYRKAADFGNKLDRDYKLRWAVERWSRPAIQDAKTYKEIDISLNMAGSSIPGTAPYHLGFHFALGSKIVAHPEQLENYASNGAVNGLDAKMWRNIWDPEANSGLSMDTSIPGLGHRTEAKVEATRFSTSGMLLFPSTKPMADEVLENHVASTAVAALSHLGQDGTQIYLNSAMATILFKGNIDEEDWYEAEAKAQGVGAALSSPQLQTYVLSEDEVKARQDFFEQCALMMAMEKFTQAHISRIGVEMQNKRKGHQSLRTPHGKYPYSKRFWMIEDRSRENNTQNLDQNSMINKFMIPNNLDVFMNLHPAVAAILVPKIRIYKVFEKFEPIVKGGGLSANRTKQVEFEFPTIGLGSGKNSETNAYPDGITRINDLYKEPSVDRGSGAGIRSFNYSFEGTSPATARNDITADLTLHFQSFNDFFRERKNSQGEEYKFVDLVLYPKKTQKVGYGKASKNQYDPSYYRIRVDVGWQLPDIEAIASVESIMGAGAGTKLKTELQKVNKSFYLNMVDHDIALKDDGSVDIKISYRAYIESLFKSNRIDALESIAIREKREEKEEKLNKAREMECSAKEVLALKNEFLKQEEALAALSQQSIMKRMFDNQRVFWCELDRSSKRQFEAQGFFTSRPYFYNGEKLSKIAKLRKYSGNATATDAEKNAYATLVRKAVDDEGLINYNFVEENIGFNQRVHYFFMGDLIYTILDCIYNKFGNEYRDLTVKNTKLILGSFDYYDFDGRPQIANIANIPISCHYFIEWFTQNVVKPRRTGYPVMYFIRDLCNQLITSLFSDMCRRTPLERKVRFNTGNFIAPGKSAGKDKRTKKQVYVDRFESLVKTCNKDGTLDATKSLVINAHNHYGTKNPALPLMSDVGHLNSIEDSFNYMLIYAVQSPTINHPGRGNAMEDKMRGVQHFHIGSRQGIVKKINFTKTDIQYLRESRFVTQGDQGLLQLGAVYKVTIEAIGNTIWYPGMEIYVNPLGIGGTEFGYPHQSTSIANQMGFGGYHIVTRVKNSIAPGKFNTTIEAQFHYSGSPKDQGQRTGTMDTSDLKPRDIELSDITNSTECGEMVHDAADQAENLRSSAGIRDIEEE